MLEPDFDKISEIAQGNFYPAIADDLAMRLGVSVDSLHRLGVGYLPSVEFKKSRNCAGWFTIPERDAQGKLLGLSIRNHAGEKVMYPGSKHGVIYDTRLFLGATQSYTPGPHNWIRTMDAGRDCPICKKPDGCLLDAKNPDDPAVVVCIRESQGSIRQLEFGFLHTCRQVRATADEQSNGNAKIPRTILIVEGMSDAATAMDLDFAVVGKPSALAGNELLGDLVRGRDVIVIGENDKKANGQEPGREGMIATWKVVRGVAKSALMLMPPIEVKDLRSWRQRGLTREQLLDCIKTHGEDAMRNSDLEDDRPTTIAKAFVLDNYREDGHITLRRWKNNWYHYVNGHYQTVEEEMFNEPLYRWAYGVRIIGDGKPKMLKTTPTIAGAIAEALGAEVLLKEEQMPCWIGDKDGRPDPRNLVVFNNGIVNVPLFCAGSPEDRYWMARTADLFTTASLPFDFSADAGSPQWLNFLDSSLGDEPSKIDLLQEWFGYCLVPDTSMDKMMYLHGPTAAGKGKILNLLCDLVGPGQHVATDFGTLCETFGVEDWVGKLVAVIGDARTPRSSDMMRGLERLLNLTGSDGVRIARKFKTALSRVQLTARLTIASNEYLDIPDHAVALPRRLNIIEFNRSFKGKEDYGLGAKLRTELQGIALWALHGLVRLRRQGYFTIPKSSVTAITEWQMETSPLASFIGDCCILQSDLSVARRELYDAWTLWSGEKGIRSISKHRFYNRLKANAPDVGFAMQEGEEVFSGINLQVDAARKFLGRV